MALIPKLSKNLRSFKQFVKAIHSPGIADDNETLPGPGKYTFQTICRIWQGFPLFCRGTGRDYGSGIGLRSAAAQPGLGTLYQPVLPRPGRLQRPGVPEKRAASYACGIQFAAGPLHPARSAFPGRIHPGPDDGPT